MFAPRYDQNQGQTRTAQAQQQNSQAAQGQLKPNYDKNHGIISGLVSSVQNYSTEERAVATVTLAGLCERVNTDGTVKKVPFFEQVKFFGNAAQLALQLQKGEAVMVNNAHIHQVKWVKEGQNMSKLIVYGASLMRLNVTESDIVSVGKSRVLKNAMNEFVISGRMVKDAINKKTHSGQVSELNIMSNRDTPAGREEHMIHADAWDNASAGQSKRGESVTITAMITTKKKIIQGEERYFTQMEARSVAVAKPFRRA